MKTLLFKERIADMEPSARPRERLIELGPGRLSDIELLCLILGSGSSNRLLGSLAADVLEVLEATDGVPEIKNLTSVNGIGPALACKLVAGIEFARRRIKPSDKRIEHPCDVVPLVNFWADRPQEYFLVLTLNGAHEVIRLRVVSQGTLDKTIVHPREIFADPLTDRAAAIICCHNHPSGSLEPSQEDLTLTKRLRDIGLLLGVPLLDHVIFTRSGYFSFLENELID